MTQNGNILNISVTRLWKKYRRLTQECMQICSPIRQVTYGFFFLGDTIDITLCEFKVYNMLTGCIYILQYSNWRQEEKGATEDEMVGGHHWLNEHEFEQTLRDSKGWGSLVCHSPRGSKESHLSNWTTTTQHQLTPLSPHKVISFFLLRTCKIQQLWSL